MMKSIFLAVALILSAAVAHAITVSKDITITVTSVTSQTVASIALSNAATTTGLSTGTAVGTLSATLAPPSPTFPYSSAQLHLSASGTESGGVCNGTNGADNGSFQITAPDSTHFDTLAISASPPTAGTKNICVAASASGVPASGQAFTVTVGNLINATSQSACSGHDGSSGNPWPATCIQAAVNAAVKGDTVFLAAGNWALTTASSAGAVQILPAINLVGAGSGNTLTAAGNPSNAAAGTGGSNGSDLCPTSSSSITCIATTGTSNNTAPGGWIQFNGCGQNDAAGAGPTSIAHVLIDGSLVTAGGDASGTVNFAGCFDAGESVAVNDVRVLGYNGANGNAEAQFSFNTVYNVAIRDTVVSAPIVPAGGSYSRASPWFVVASSGLTVNNSYMYESSTPPISVDNASIVGNTINMSTDGSGNVFGTEASLGMEGCALGAICENGARNGSIGFTLTNNYIQASGVAVGVGGGLNDPGTGGALFGISFTGNTVTAATASIDSCVWHYYNPGAADVSKYFACAPAIQATAATTSGGNLTFTLPDGPPARAIIHSGTFQTVGFTPSQYNTADVSGGPTVAFSVTASNCTGGSCTITTPGTASGTATVQGIIGTWPGGSSEAMQINGVVQTDCSVTAPPSTFFTVQNNSIIGTNYAQLVMTGNGMMDCFIPPAQTVRRAHNNTVNNLLASQNYFSSPSNQYIHDANTINPSVTANFCGGSGTFTQTDSSTCATSGFTNRPTASFTLGPLTKVLGVSAAPFTATSFTAQYGAVQWLASTSSTTPTSSGQSSTGCNGGACSWSYVPPAYMMGATHGNTVYLWTMDQALNISPAALVVIP